MSVHELLVKTRDLLSDPARWCKKAVALDGEGRPVPSLSVSAASFCLLGSLSRCYHEDRLCGPEFSTAIHSLNALCGRFPSSFNDDPSTTHADVLALLDRAIEGAPHEK